MKLLAKMWRDERLKVYIFFFLMAFFAVAQVFFWPTISKLLPAVEARIPEPFKGIFSGMVSQGFVYFIITQQFMKLIGFFGSFFAVLLAANAMIKEIENGTMELLMAQPVSRTRVFIEKYSFGALAIAFVVIVGGILASPAAGLVNEELDFWNTLLASIIGFLVLLLLYSFLFTISLFLEDQMQTISLGLGLSLLMSVLVLFKETKWLSIYNWLDPDFLLPVMKQGIMPWSTCLFLLLLSLSVAGIGLVKFRKMNI